jgi:hypothetical protein
MSLKPLSCLDLTIRGGWWWMPQHQGCNPKLDGASKPLFVCMSLYWLDVVCDFVFDFVVRHFVQSTGTS